MGKAWSYSALTSFETCARRHYVLRVAKLLTEPESEEVRWGRVAHKALELRCLNKAALPQSLAYLEPVASMLTQQQGRRIVEDDGGKLAVDASFRPCSWFSKNPPVWCRSVVDFGIIGTESAVLIDWKTGKRKPDNDQLELFAAIGFAHFPFLQRIHTSFVWLKDKKIDSDAFTRDQIGQLWSKFLPRVQRLDHAHETNTWSPKPSGLCGKWCPVTQQHCAFGRAH